MGRSQSTERAVDNELDPGREARARAWSYVFECYERKKVGAGEPSLAGEEAKGDDDAACTDGGSY